MDEFWYDTSTGKQEGTKQAAVDYLSGHPEFHKVVFITESSDWVPVMLGGFETIGRQNDVIIGSHNEDTWTLSHFEETEKTGSPYIATTTYQPYLYGDYIGKMLDKLFAGEEVDKYTYLDHVAMTRENYKDFKATMDAAKAAIS